MNYPSKRTYYENENNNNAYEMCYPLSHIGAIYTKDDESETLDAKLTSIINGIGDITTLSTTEKESLVLAINELFTNKASLVSPSLTGTPSAPTASADTNTTQIATTAFVLGQVSALLPIMNGIAAIGTSNKYARADHVHPNDTSKANLTSPAFTGSPTIGGFNVVRAISGGYLTESGQTNIVVSTAGSGVSLAITFSTAFPNGCDCVLPVIITTSVGTAGYINLSANNASKTGFTLGANSYVSQTIAVQWIAFGH